MDFHKSLPTQKMSSQDWYYSKKLKTSLMGIYYANQEVIQTEQGRDRYDHLIVWCDNSLAQFKQNFLLFMWITWSQEEMSNEQT